VLVAAIALLYWPTVASLWDRWQPDPSYSHGWLIFVISGWLIWREARAGRLADGQPHWLGVAAIPVLGIAWLLAMAGSIGIVQWLLLPAFIFAAAFALYGWTALRRLWFPIGFTLFAIPIWDGLTPVLQAITVEVVGVALMAFHIPALLIGNRVELPSGTFEIVEGCSGAHYFMVSATLATLYGWLWYRRLGLTLGLLAAALAVAMFANWLRVFLVIYAGYLTEMQHFLVQVDHYYFGWVMYMVLMAPVFWYARRFEPEHPASPQANNPSTTTPPLRHAAFALAALAIAPAAWWLLSMSETRPAPEAMPSGEAGWQLSGAARPDWEPRYRGADATLNGAYWRGTSTVDAWIVYYRRPAQGGELASQTNRLANRRDGRLEVSNGEAVLHAGGGRRLIRYTHIIGGRESSGLMEAKLQQIIATLSGRPEAALLAISTNCGVDCEVARETLGAFEQDMGTRLRQTIAAEGASTAAGDGASSANGNGAEAANRDRAANN